MQKTCLSCGSKITGRADKKYCNDACKNDFHNHHSGPPAHYERNQIAIALKNHKILRKIASAGIGEIGTKELEVYGFNFEGLTGLKLLSQDNYQLFCFDYVLNKNGASFILRKK